MLVVKDVKSSLLITSWERWSIVVDKSQDLRQASPETLTQVIRLGQQQDIDWSPRDLQDMLEHLLTSPLVDELTGLNGINNNRVEHLVTACQPPIVTFDDLFTTTQPPVELLTLVKHYAKMAADLPDRTLPEPVTSVLYTAAIAAARVRCQEKVTSHNDQKIRKGVIWALDQPWIAASLAILFRQFLQEIPT